jgi:hypothetical protein
MPFESKAQSRYLFATNPKVAKEFAAKTPSIKALPEKVPASGDDWHKAHADKFRRNAMKNKK